MNRIIVALLSLAIAACAVGYTSQERVIGVAGGQAALTNCVPAEELTDCQAIHGGSISQQFTELVGGITGAIRGLIFGPPD